MYNIINISFIDIMIYERRSLLGEIPRFSSNKVNDKSICHFIYHGHFHFRYQPHNIESYRSTNFPQKFANITRIKARILWNISIKTVPNIYYYLQNSKKAKNGNHFISVKQFQKRPNGNPLSSLYLALSFRDPTCNSGVCM